MVQKRQLTEEEYDVSPKHLKLEHSCELVPYLQFTKEDAPLLSDKPIIEFDYGFLSNKIEKDDENTLPGRLSTSSLASSTTSEEEDLKSENTYSYLLRHPPLKEVPIGPQYQAQIPKWNEINPQHDDNEIKFMGFCVISIQDTDTDTDTVGKGKTDCFCENRGSLKCTQQHINEARETLKGKIGNKKFTDLGFGNMGESVAEKWTEDEEQLFHEVVYSNPVSFGQNFWKHLSKVFPSRSNQEIVSYYFNVFMLRKRAEQNRCDPVNVDSDDDEWQGSDESEENDDIRECDSDEHGNGIGNSVTDHYRGNHEFMFEQSDSRVWDIGYFSCSRIESDFLPIEEVFGVESWDFEVINDDKSSN